MKKIGYRYDWKSARFLRGEWQTKELALRHALAEVLENSRKPDKWIAVQLKKFSDLLKKIRDEEARAETAMLAHLLRDTVARLESFIGSDCECGNLHEAMDWRCCLCECRRVLRHFPAVR